MSAVRGLTPYILLDPEDDEEGTKSVIAQALKPKLKAPLPSGSPLKRGEKKPNLGEKKATDPGISKAHVKPRFQPSVPAKPHRVDTAAETPRKDSKGSDASE